MEFCVAFSLQKSFRGTISMLGEDMAQLVAAAWCARMQWLYDKYMVEGHAVDFSDEAMKGFIESAEVSKAYEEGGPALRSRMDVVRSMKPRHGAI